MDILFIILIVVLVLVLLGGVFPVGGRWPVGYGVGHPMNIGLLVILLVIIVLVFVR